MGKFIIYGLIALIALFVLEFFQIVDIPYLEIPDYVSEKKGMTQKQEASMKELK